MTSSIVCLFCCFDYSGVYALLQITTSKKGFLQKMKISFGRKTGSGAAEADANANSSAYDFDLLSYSFDLILLFLVVK